jgi:hypothetical protein
MQLEIRRDRQVAATKLGVEYFSTLGEFIELIELFAHRSEVTTVFTDIFSVYVFPCTGVCTYDFHAPVITQHESGRAFQNAIQTDAFGDDKKITVQRNIHTKMLRRRKVRR